MYIPPKTHNILLKELLLPLLSGGRYNQFTIRSIMPENAYEAEMEKKYV